MAFSLFYMFNADTLLQDRNVFTQKSIQLWDLQKKMEMKDLICVSAKERFIKKIHFHFQVQILDIYTVFSLESIDDSLFHYGSTDFRFF